MSDDHNLIPQNELQTNTESPRLVAVTRQLIMFPLDGRECAAAQEGGSA